MVSSRVLVLAALLCSFGQAQSADDVIDLSGQSTIDEVESLIKESSSLWEQMITFIVRNTSIAELANSAPGSTPTERIGNILTRAYVNRPIFRLPNMARPSTAPLCGGDVQQSACGLLRAHNSGHVYFLPFDLDDIVKDDRSAATWHRNSPLVSLVRLCFGLKASTKYEAAQTCIGMTILEKLTALIDDYPEHNISTRQFTIGKKTVSSRYLSIKAILKNFNYANDGAAAQHGKGVAADILCGLSAGSISGSAENNCSLIEQMCKARGANNVVTPAELNGCGKPKSPINSIHCAFIQRPIITLSPNLTTAKATRIIREHYQDFEEKTNEAITTTVADVAKVAAAKKMSVDDAVDMVKQQMKPQMSDIIRDVSENGVIFNVSSFPRRNYQFQFRRVNFRLDGGIELPPAPNSNGLLSRGTRQASPDPQALQCPFESVEMAKKLLDLHSSNAKLSLLPNVFHDFKVSAIEKTLTDVLSGNLSLATRSPATSTVQAPLASLLNAATTGQPSIDEIDTSPLINIWRMAIGLKALNEDGNFTCISYEVLNGIYNMANTFYESHRQKLYVAAFTATAFHTFSTESRAHTSGTSVNLLCGSVYDGRNGLCPEIMGTCFASKMFVRAMLGGLERGGSGCLADNMGSIFGVVHCRSR